MIAAVVAAVTAVAVPAVAYADNPPVCQTVLFAENSGNGPNFPVKVCNNGGPALTRLPAGERWVFVVDGGGLPERSTRVVTVVIAEVRSR